MGLNECEKCEGSFPLHSYFDYKVSQTCRSCVFRSELETKLKAITQHAEKLTNRVNALEDFVANNVAIESGSRLRSEEWPAISRRTPATTNKVTNVRPNNSVTNNNNDTSPQFQRVRNGAKPTTREFLPIKMYNKFQILAEVEEDAHETRLTGDSLIASQLTEFCGRAPNSRKRYCMPGASIDEITAACDEVTNGATKDTLIVLHVGTNDVQKTRSEELLQKYRKLIQKYKVKSDNIIISGVLPKMYGENTFYNKAFSLNNRLKNLCRQEGVKFIDTWDNFYQKPELFGNDGLHLNSVGSARFGRLLSEAVLDFWAKNEHRTTLTVEET